MSSPTSPIQEPLKADVSVDSAEGVDNHEYNLPSPTVDPTEVNEGDESSQEPNVLTMEDVITLIWNCTRDRMRTSYYGLPWELPEVQSAEDFVLPVTRGAYHYSQELLKDFCSFDFQRCIAHSRKVDRLTNNLEDQYRYLKTFDLDPKSAEWIMEEIERIKSELRSAVKDAKMVGEEASEYSKNVMTQLWNDLSEREDMIMTLVFLQIWVDPAIQEIQTTRERLEFYLQEIGSVNPGCCHENQTLSSLTSDFDCGLQQGSDKSRLDIWESPKKLLNLERLKESFGYDIATPCEEPNENCEKSALRKVLLRENVLEAVKLLTDTSFTASLQLCALKEYYINNPGAEERFDAQAVKKYPLRTDKDYASIRRTSRTAPPPEYGLQLLICEILLYGLTDLLDPPEPTKYREYDPQLYMYVGDLTEANRILAGETVVSDPLSD